MVLKNVEFPCLDFIDFDSVSLVFDWVEKVVSEDHHVVEKGLLEEGVTKVVFHYEWC